jgi:hypothetical protein
MVIMVLKVQFPYFTGIPFFSERSAKERGPVVPRRKRGRRKMIMTVNRLMGNLLQRMILRCKETVFGRNMSIRRIG